MSGCLVTTAEQAAEDFVRMNVLSCADCILINTVAQMGFLGNLVKVFPGLAKRPLLLTGESYAGTYIVCPALVDL